MPASAPSRRALAHDLKLTSDLLQGAVRSGGSDIGDQVNEAIIPTLPSRAVQQLRLDHPFRHKPAHGPPEPFNRPRAFSVVVEHADNVAPGLVGSLAPTVGNHE